MGWLIDEIRSWFCKHNYECLIEKAPIYEDYFAKIPSYYKWVYVCKKCKRKKIVTSEKY